MTDSLDIDAGVPDLRRMPVADAVRWLAEHGEPADPRAGIDTAALRERFPRLSKVQIHDLTIETPHGPQPARTYRDPSAPSTGRGLVWVHGGAFIGGHLDMPESNWVALELAARGVPVFAVDYTKCLGQAHFPVPSDDVLAAWRFARENAVELLGVDPGELFLGGGSAGGNLTAGVAVRIRDAAESAPAGLVLVYPALHPNGPEASRELDLESPMSGLTMNFVGDVAVLDDPHAFAGLSGGRRLPPMLVVACENDPLRTSGEVFARLVTDAGGSADLHLEPGADHGHIDHPGDAGALRTLAAMAEWVASR